MKPPPGRYVPPHYEKPEGRMWNWNGWTLWKATPWCETEQARKVTACASIFTVMLLILFASSC